MRNAALSISAALLTLIATACSGGSSQSNSETHAQSTTQAAAQPSTETSGGTTTGAAAPSLPVGGKPFKMNPADFTAEIDNPYWPMKPGSRWVFHETNAQGSDSRVVVTVLHKTKTVMGIEARIVHDRVSQNGQVEEDTYDWYAQDAEGNLWYLGEDTRTYENGKLKTKEGSWEAGVDGALAGIILPAHPQVGMTYREEYYKGHAEDGASIFSVDAFAKVPYGTFSHALQTRNFSGIEPDVIEEKIYAKGVGVVLEITVSGGSDRTELVRYKEG